MTEPVNVGFAVGALAFQVAAEAILSSAKVPVVILLVSKLGISAATNVLNVGVPVDPLGAAKTLFCVCVAHVPVNVPEVVTGLPVTVISEGKLNPTLVTVPSPVPAPIAVLKSAAVNALTVLSAFVLINRIALGFVSVNKLLPTVVAPRPVLALVGLVGL